MPIQLCNGRPTQVCARFVAAAATANPSDHLHPSTAGMVVVTVDKPRPGTGVSLREFKRRGADVLLIGLTPGAQGSVAAVKWRNPQVNFTSQQPAAMELVLLRELPHAEGGRQAAGWLQVVFGGTSSERRRCKCNPTCLLFSPLAQYTHPPPCTTPYPPPCCRTQDAAATRVLLRDLLDSVPPGTLKYVHIFDKQAGAAYSTSLGGNLSIEAIVRRNHAELLAAVQGLPVTHLGNVVSSALSRTLHLSSAKLKQLVALQTALAIFPQATGQIK